MMGAARSGTGEGVVAGVSAGGDLEAHESTRGQRALVWRSHRDTTGSSAG